MKNLIRLTATFLFVGALMLAVVLAKPGGVLGADSVDEAAADTVGDAAENAAEKLPGKKYRCETFVIATVEGVIDPVMKKYIDRVIVQAEREGDACLIIEIDTPGGLLQSMKEIATRMLNTRVPVVVYVYPSGATSTSAGFFLLMASDVAAMAPSTSTGSAAPIQMQGKMGKTQKEKAFGFAASYMETLAKRQGRNIRLAKRAVTKSISITEDEALEKNVIEIIADDPTDLMEKLNGRKFVKKKNRYKLRTKEFEVKRLAMSWQEKALHLIAHPNIAYILFMIGVYGVIFEVTHPGAIYPGAVGAVALILAFMSFSVLPINVAGLVLLAGAFVMFALELKIVSHGLFTLGGTILMILGSLMLIDSTDPSFRVSLEVIITAVAMTVLVFVVALAAVVKTHKSRVTTGEQGMVGKRGKVRTALSPEGKVLVHGELWDARSEDGTTLEPGTKVEVVSKEDMELVVRRR